MNYTNPIYSTSSWAYCSSVPGTSVETPSRCEHVCRERRLIYFRENRVVDRDIIAV